MGSSCFAQASLHGERRERGCGCPSFSALEAQAYSKAGRNEAALGVIEQAIAISDETGERWCLAEILRIKAALLSATGGASDQVEILLAQEP